MNREYQRPRGRPPNKPRLDESQLDEIRQEIKILGEFEQDGNTEFGKRLVKILDASIENVIKELISKKLEDMSTDGKLIFFLGSVRSKLQTLYELKNRYVNAKQYREELITEFNKLVS